MSVTGLDGRLGRIGGHVSHSEDSPWARPRTDTPAGDPDAGEPTGRYRPAGAPGDGSDTGQPVTPRHRDARDGELDPATRREAERWRAAAAATADPRWARPGTVPTSTEPVEPHPREPRPATADPVWAAPTSRPADDGQSFRWGAASLPESPSGPPGPAGPSGPSGAAGEAREFDAGRTTPARATGRRVAGALAVTAGGVLTAVAAFLTWTTVGVLDITQIAIQGTDADQDGNATFALGALAALAGAYALRRQASGRVWLVSGTAGAMIVLLAIVEILRAGRAGTPGDAELGLTVDVGPGLWLTLTGGGLVVVATIVGGVARSGRRSAGLPSGTGDPDGNNASATPSLGS
jgi:hypothetical protein